MEEVTCVVDNMVTSYVVVAYVAVYAVVASTEEKKEDVMADMWNRVQSVDKVADTLVVDTLVEDTSVEEA